MLVRLVPSLWNLGVAMTLCVLVAMATKSADSGCDPVVDLLFVLDTSSGVNSSGVAAQENFVRSLLADHQAPEGATRTALMTCGDANDVTTTPFNSSLSALLHSLGQTTNTPTDIQHGRHCLNNLNFKFKTEARTAVSRIAVILRGSWSWEEARVHEQSEVARQDGTVIVVVAIGIRDFGSLAVMQTLAYSDVTFFVVSSYKDLQYLAKNLSKGSCQPISLDLISEKSGHSQTTKQPPVKHKMCIQLSRYMFKRFVPGFGYTRQRCLDGQTLDLARCQCQP